MKPIPPLSATTEDRRVFIRSLLIAGVITQSGALTVLCSRLLSSDSNLGLLPDRSAAGCTPTSSASAPSDPFSPAAFVELQGTCFLVAGQPLWLDHVAYRARDRLDTVSLRFRGRADSPLAERSHRFHHATHPSLDLFIVPGTVADGETSYRVTICRLAPEHPHTRNLGARPSLPGSQRSETTPV